MPVALVAPAGFREDPGVDQRLAPFRWSHRMETRYDEPSDLFEIELATGDQNASSWTKIPQNAIRIADGDLDVGATPHPPTTPPAPWPRHSRDRR
jgi:hypothetical protein